MIGFALGLDLSTRSPPPPPPAPDPLLLPRSEAKEEWKLGFVIQAHRLPALALAAPASAAPAAAPGDAFEFVRVLGDGLVDDVSVVAGASWRVVCELELELALSGEPGPWRLMLDGEARSEWMSGQENEIADDG